MQINASDILGSGELQIPEGIDARTETQRELYRAALEFERFFVHNMMKQMKAATDALKGDDGEGIADASTGAYEDMITDQMTSAVLDGGGLGLAAVLYDQVNKGGMPL